MDTGSLFARLARVFSISNGTRTRPRRRGRLATIARLELLEARTLLATSMGAVVNSDGTIAAFESTADLGGSNPDGSREIFLVNAITSSLIQVTDVSSPTDGVSSNASINGDGSLVAFESTADLIGTNSDGNSEIFLYDTTTSGITPVTNATTGESANASINEDGTKIVFQSSADLVGENSDGNVEIFLFDTVTAAFTQITNTIESESASASINGDGMRIAFSSNADLTGGNADRNYEIFVYDVAANTFSQTTDAASGESTRPSIDDDGIRIAFESTADLTGGNADENQEIFWFDIASGVAQVTHTRADEVGAKENVYPSISGAGTRIAFESTAVDYPYETREVFLFDIPTGETTKLTSGRDGDTGPSAGAVLSGDGNWIVYHTRETYTYLRDLILNERREVTEAVGPSNTYPSISADGSRVAFESTKNLAGTNPDGNSEIFLAVYGLDGDVGYLQATDSTEGASRKPSLAGNSATIAFESSANLTGMNADGNVEIFYYDMETRDITQVTHTTGISIFSVGAAISGDGQWIAFESTADLTGDNSDGNREIFLFDVANASFVQVTHSTGWGSSGAALSFDGTKLAFDSFGDLTGGNADRNREIYLFDVASATFRQVTDTAIGASSGASINSDGTKIAFDSTADLKGDNPDGSREVYGFDASADLLTEVTHNTHEYTRSFDPSISGDGTRIAYHFSPDRIEGSEHGNIGVYVFDASANFSTQMIDTDYLSSYSSGVSINGDGTRVAFSLLRNIYMVRDGDYNGDGFVHQEDLDLVLTEWGKPAFPAPDDWVYDLPGGIVDQAELDAVLINWGATSPPADEATGQAVPESQPVSVAATRAVAAARAKAREAKLRMDALEPVLAARDHVFDELVRHRAGLRSPLPTSDLLRFDGERH